MSNCGLISAPLASWWETWDWQRVGRAVTLGPHRANKQRQDVKRKGAAPHTITALSLIEVIELKDAILGAPNIRGVSSVTRLTCNFALSSLVVAYCYFMWSLKWKTGIDFAFGAGLLVAFVCVCVMWLISHRQITKSILNLFQLLSCGACEHPRCSKCNSVT